MQRPKPTMLGRNTLLLYNRQSWQLVVLPVLERDTTHRAEDRPTVLVMVGCKRQYNAGDTNDGNRAAASVCRWYGTATCFSAEQPFTTAYTPSSVILTHPLRFNIVSSLLCCAS